MNSPSQPYTHHSSPHPTPPFSTFVYLNFVVPSFFLISSFHSCIPCGCGGSLTHLRYLYGYMDAIPSSFILPIHFIQSLSLMHVSCIIQPHDMLYHPSPITLHRPYVTHTHK